MSRKRINCKDVFCLDTIEDAAEFISIDDLDQIVIEKLPENSDEA